jgi:hypothetical protein
VTNNDKPLPDEVETAVLEAAQRLFPGKVVRVGKDTGAWKRHALFARLLHRLGLHDYMPSFEFDLEQGRISGPRMTCSICHVDA